MSGVNAPWSVCTVGTPVSTEAASALNGECTWSTSKRSAAFRSDAAVCVESSTMSLINAVPGASSKTNSRLALVSESPVANSVTS